MVTVVPVYGSNRMRVRWQDASSDETGFRVERKTGAAAFASIAVVGADVQEYLDGTPGPDTDYAYRVVAYNADGEAASGEGTNRIAVTWTLSNGDHEMMNGWQDGSPINWWGFHEGIDIQSDGQGGQEVVAARMGRGQYFGEIELLRGGAPIATIRAGAEGVEVMALDRPTIDALLSSSPATREAIAKVAEAHAAENVAARRADVA